MRVSQLLRRCWTGAGVQRPPLAIQEIITQDEYTHDVLVPFLEGRYLVYDIT